MKLSTFILPVLITTASFSGVAAQAEYQVFHEQHCYENVERMFLDTTSSNGRYVSAKVKNKRRKVGCDQAQTAPTGVAPTSYGGSFYGSFGNSDIAHGYHQPHYPQQQTNYTNNIIHNNNSNNRLLSINHRISAMVNFCAWV